ncbi:hypothetical protein SAMN05443270_1489 [Lacrimispora sphenoides]|nr:hypothetical protein [Lacrimispora sphenoides]SET80277.1 hypothetical protein SAMN05443270_1489 [Lacrimispora sphenoides]
MYFEIIDNVQKNKYSQEELDTLKAKLENKILNIFFKNDCTEKPRVE